MKAIDLRKKNKDELSLLFIELSRERFNLKMQKATSQLTKSDQIKKVRRDMARIQTMLSQMASAKK
jgi:large subunit ribosomal protein L29